MGSAQAFSRDESPPWNDTASALTVLLVLKKAFTAETRGGSERIHVCRLFSYKLLDTKHEKGQRQDEAVKCKEHGDQWKRALHAWIGSSIKQWRTEMYWREKIPDLITLNLAGILQYSSQYLLSTLAAKLLTCIIFFTSCNYSIREIKLFAYYRNKKA